MQTQPRTRHTQEDTDTKTNKRAHIHNHTLKTQKNADKTYKRTAIVLYNYALYVWRPRRRFKEEAIESTQKTCAHA